MIIAQIPKAPPRPATTTTGPMSSAASSFLKTRTNNGFSPHKWGAATWKTFISLGGIQ